jgi:bacterioferritin
MRCRLHRAPTADFPSSWKRVTLTSPNQDTYWTKGDLDMDKFMTDIKKLRDNARKNMEKGSVTEAYKADVKQVIKVLNDVLATELVCVMRYKRHYYMAQGISSDSVKEEFLQHATEEQQHADWVAERITQLGGEPDFNPRTIADRSASEYVEGKGLVDMIKEDLVAERIAIQSYSEIIRWLGDGDPTSRLLIEQINKVEEEHANDMLDLLAKMG